MQTNPHPRAAWPSGDDNAGFNLIVIAFGLCVGSVLLWINYHTEVSGAVMALRHHEISLLRHFTNRFDLADQQMALSDPAEVTLQNLYGISHAVGLSWRIPATVFIVALAIVCTVRNAPGRFRREFDLHGLAEELAVSFPTGAAFARRRALELVTPADGEPRPADYALTPAEWIKRYAARPDGMLDIAAARGALALQLGAPWRGALDAEPPARCLFVVFALHLAGQSGMALDLLGQMSAAFADDAIDEKYGPARPLVLPVTVLASVDALLHHKSPDIVKALADAADIAGGHAWTNTALMGLLNATRRKTGVLAPGQFAWLKLVDRRLWYALHSLGFETEGFGHYLHPNPRVEALGARDHWAVERAIGAPVADPDFARAIDALQHVGKSASRKRP